MILSLLIVIGLVLLWNTSTAGLKRYDLPMAFVAKLVFGCLFMYIYSRIYGIGADTVDWEEFIHDSIVLKNVAFESPGTYLKFLFGFSNEADVLKYLGETDHWSAGDLTLMNDSRNVLRANSLIAFFSGGNIYFHISFLSFFVVLALRQVYLTFYQNVIVSRRLFWYLMALFPSVLFWTSSMLKEPFMMIGLCFLIAGCFRKLPFSGRWWRIALGLLLMLGFKPYVLLCLIIPIIIYGASQWFRLSIALLYAMVICVGIIGVFAFSSLRDTAVQRITRMQYDFINVGKGGMHVEVGDHFYYFPVEQFDSIDTLNDLATLKYPLTGKYCLPGAKLPFEDVQLTPEDGPWPIYFVGTVCGSYVEITPINNSFSQLMANVPEAFVNAAFRPIPFDPGSNLKNFNFLETILLFGTLLFSFFSGRFKRNKPERKQIVTLLVFAFCLFVLIGWTTPVLGAVVRYRIPAYFAVLLAALIGHRKIQSS